MQLNTILLVGAGGAIGSILRYVIAIVWNTKSFPYATFAVNIAGSFLIGIFFALLIKHNLSDNNWRFLATGLCGGFTTFSAMSLEGFELLSEGRFLVFTLYFLLSITLGLAATYLGYFVTRYA